MAYLNHGRTKTVLVALDGVVFHEDTNTLKDDIIETLTNLRDSEHFIIIISDRPVLRHDGREDLHASRVVDTLARNRVPYDEIIFEVPLSGFRMITKWGEYKSIHIDKL